MRKIIGKRVAREEAARIRIVAAESPCPGLWKELD